MIKVNENTCIGCGACVAIAPENFDFNESGLSTVISETITESTEEAASACPVNAISISNETASTEESKIIELKFQNDEEATETEETETKIAA